VPQVPRVVSISDGNKLIVPTLVGMPVRKVIELASTAGLDVQIIGSGTAREQAPAPGTKVHTGTKIVVHCTH
jgi:cell division protein FtsI (penicillin-binding protein 3)